MDRACTIGLVGCGQWGSLILRDLLSLGCRVAVVDRSARNAQAARDLGAIAAVNTLGDLAAVDGFVIATIATSHAAVVEAALDRDVPVFVEKPFTTDRASAARLAAMAPGRLFVMDKWRYHPGVELLGEIARSGELGPVVGLRTLRLGWGNPHADTDAIWTLAPHDLAIALEVLGEIPPPRSAVADVMADVPIGLLGLLGSSPWVAMEVSARSRERRREVRLHCRDGVAILGDAYSAHVQVARRIDSTDTTVADAELRPVSSALPLLRELRAFVEHLAGGPPPRSSAAEGAAVVDAIATLRELAGLDPG